MRNMSFFLTTPQFIARQKLVTRRLGWWFLEVNDLVMGVEKGQGLGKGGKIKRLGPIRIVAAGPERLNQITPADVALEGFPNMTPADFVRMFCDHNKVKKCRPETVVNRIAFEYLDPDEVPR